MRTMTRTREPGSSEKKSPSKWPFYICTMYDQRPISEAANVDIFHPLILGIFSSGANSNQADRKYATCKGVETTLKFSRRELNLEMNIITMVTQREMCKLFRLCLDQLSPLTWSIFHYLIFQFPKNYKGEVENHRGNLRQIQKYTLLSIFDTFKTPSTSFVRHSALLSGYCFRQFAFGEFPTSSLSSSSYTKSCKQYIKNATNGSRIKIEFYFFFVTDRK